MKEISGLKQIKLDKQESKKMTKAYTKLKKSTSYIWDMVNFSKCLCHHSRSIQYPKVMIEFVVTTMKNS